MKFYAPRLIEDDEGEYVTRDDAEQVARDVVDLAKAILGYDTRLQLVMKAQAVIERYEGGKG